MPPSATFRGRKGWYVQKIVNEILIKFTKIALLRLLNGFNPCYYVVCKIPSGYSEICIGEKNGKLKA